MDVQAEPVRPDGKVLITEQQSSFFAHRITLEGLGEDALAQSLSTARVDMNPHQVDAALFALASPLSKGVILADEVGLGKTIEASLVIAQRWAERKRRILLIVPASLRKQWSQELAEKFSLPSVIIEAKSHREARKAGVAVPFDRPGEIIITSYEFAASKADEITHLHWDLVVYDEAHRLRNVYKKGASVRAKKLREATRRFFKLLLTATPLQNSLMELYGLVSVIDEQFFGDDKVFRAYLTGASGNNALVFLRKRLEPICKRTLRRQVQQAGLIKYGYSGFVVGSSDFPTIERRGAIPSHGILSERSSPSRVRFAAKNAPLTAPGRSEDLSVTKEWEISGTAALHVAGPMSPGYPLKTQKSLKYTECVPLTFQFEASDDEMQLYNAVSAYLQRPDTIAFGDRPNALVTLIVRKILGSSTSAVAETLGKIIDRLKAKERPSMEIAGDIDTADEIAEELAEDTNAGQVAQEPPIDPKKLADEIAELEGYRALAIRIGKNAKGSALINVLPEALKQIEGKGGDRKAVIFTESVRTQRYLAELLDQNGYKGEIVLLNGTNSDAISQELYKDWLERHKGTDAVSGSRTADMKAAVVEAFRDRKTILIATESGAEGINLQFCSALRCSCF